MLKTRVISAVVLIPLVLFLLIFSPVTTAFFCGVTAALGTFEFYRMASKSPNYRFRPVELPGYVAAAGLSLAGLLRSPLGMGLILLGTGLIVLALVFTDFQLRADRQKLEKPSPNEPGGKPLNNWIITMFGAVYTGVPLGLVALVRATPPEDKDLWWIVLMFLGTWGADTGAYFAGRAFGKRKLAPNISPNKTVEGAYGGVATAILGVSLVGGLALGIPLWVTIPLGVLLAVASIVGDLYESWMKRKFGIKDSGSMIPGHGGILDRIDSFLAVALVTSLFALIYNLVVGI
jgi:phosphatidate cytidylyltransferase